MFGAALSAPALGAGLSGSAGSDSAGAEPRRRIRSRPISRRPISRRPISRAEPDAAQSGDHQSGLRAARRPARRLRPRRRRPGPRRPDQAVRRRHRQAAGRPRPRHRASAQVRLRRRRIFRAVLGAVAAMRADHVADPADARQSRPHDERSASSSKRQLRSGRPAPRADRTIGAEQLRRAIYRRSQFAGRPARLFRRAVRRRHDPQPERRRRADRAPITPSACAPATAIISRSRIRRCRAILPTTQRACQRVCPAAEVALYTYRNPGETWIRRYRPTASSIPRCRTPSAIASNSSPACSCRRPGQSWADALKNADDSSTLESGDIVVTDQNAKALSQPPKPGGKAGATARRKPARRHAASPRLDRERRQPGAKARRARGRTAFPVVVELRHAATQSHVSGPSKIRRAGLGHRRALDQRAVGLGIRRAGIA